MTIARKSRRRTAAAGAAVLLGCILLAGAAASGGGAIPPDLPAPPRVLHLAPVWSVDPDTLPSAWGGLLDAVIDARDRIYLLDWQLHTVHVLDGAGRPVRDLGRPGDGPGELRAPGALVLLPDDGLGVISAMLARVTVLDRDTGAPRPGLRLAGSGSDVVQLVQARCVTLPDGAPALVGVVGENLGRLWHLRYYLALYRLDRPLDLAPPDRELATVGLLQGRDVEREEYYQLWRPWDALPDGRVVYAPDWHRPRLVITDPAGHRPDVTVDFPYRPGRRTGRQRRRLLAVLWGGTDPAPYGIDLQTSDREPAVREVLVRPGGEIWVRTGRSGETAGVPGGFRRYRVFGTDGSPRRDVVLAGDGDDATDRLLFFPGGDVLLWRGGEIPPHAPDAVPVRLTRCRLLPPPGHAGAERVAASR